MIDNNNDDTDEVDRLSQAAGIPYKVRISPELSELLKPNKFLRELGIKYFDRVKLILSILKGSMIYEKENLGEMLPKQNQRISLPLTKGPYITEEITSIKAEVTDNGGGARITLAPVHEENN